MIDDFNKRQRVIDLGEEAEDEILASTGKKTDSIFNTPQYKKVMEACKQRDKIPTQAWTPDEPEIDFTKDSEYIRLYGSKD